MAEPETKPQTRFQTLQGVVSEARRAHGWNAALVVSEDGLPLAGAPGVYSAEVLAALIAQLQRMAGQTRKPLGWPAVAELSITGTDGSRLVWRGFVARGQTLILAVILPDRLAYRRALAQTTRAIRQTWESR